VSDSEGKPSQVERVVSPYVRALLNPSHSVHGAIKQRKLEFLASIAYCAVDEPDSAFCLTSDGGKAFSPSALLTAAYVFGVDPIKECEFLRLLSTQLYDSARDPVAFFWWKLLIQEDGELWLVADPNAVNNDPIHYEDDDPNFVPMSGPSEKIGQPASPTNSKRR